MQVAARGPACGAYGGDDLPGAHAVAGLYPDSLEVIVGGDQTVAVVEFHTVSAAPGVPAGSTDNTGIR
ncbi:hypothetical protein GCM10027404_17390 [Arthrobacter tumbae]